MSAFVVHNSIKLFFCRKSLQAFFNAFFLLLSKSVFLPRRRTRQWLFRRNLQFLRRKIPPQLLGCESARLYYCQFPALRLSMLRRPQEDPRIVFRVWTRVFGYKPEDVPM